MRTVSLLLASTLTACVATSQTDGTLIERGGQLALGGEMSYMADAARLTECLSGRSYPVAMEGEYLAMERAYLQAATSPGAPLYVTLEGVLEQRPKMDGAGTEPNVVVRRFIHAWPGQTCERARANSELVNTLWRVVRLEGEAVSVVEGRREPSIILRNNAQGYSATAGCNQLGGAYKLEGNALTLSPGISTLMACPPPLDELERRLIGTLSKVRQWRITAATLELSDEKGKSLALFEAVYL
jgi:copper homeostasis protein (lipoprotein)